MSTGRELTLRQREILHAIVQAYIATGEPVASRTIARAQQRLRLSPASIRNIMADLADEGYLSQPHTSAGRVPTEKAFRCYIHSLGQSRVLQAEVQRLRDDLARHATLEGRLGQTSRLLSEMTSVVGIAAAIPSSQQMLEQIELVALPDRRVLMIVATSDRQVHNRVVTLDHPPTQDELNDIRNYLNRKFAGWTLAEARRELEERLREERALYDAVLRRIDLLYRHGLLHVGQDPPVRTEGVSNLVGLDLHLTRERMRELLANLEQKERILQLLDRFLEQRGGELAVQVGLADIHPAMGELSLVGLTVDLEGGLCAKVAVVGPMRMDYVRTILAVRHIAQAFGRVPA